MKTDFSTISLVKNVELHWVEQLAKSLGYLGKYSVNMLYITKVEKWNNVLKAAKL